MRYFAHALSLSKNADPTLQPHPQEIGMESSTALNPQIFVLGARQSPSTIDDQPACEQSELESPHAPPGP